ncbi:putative transaldolase [Coccomyxa subellipsoidea C-169]|uniref:Transaldolase n=1 Tax=Coccomyxa subellipsoidea (strain C-169) TaxID=574566 RepID=I0Z9L5_COCSC|nr:putative transaldolase [Coccomyxa subellipsoidea C-169]EIE27334.1 putative transaldolase [Coccomyxa subellipsoidea C-169]|eukprot:XP_005651878.1 putative transaldolase [Coccomyxa subellipsoidea C-169]
MKVLKVLAQQAFSLGAQELQLQAWGGTAGRLYSVGLDLAALDTRIVVKLPITDAGVEAAGLLRSQGVRLTLTGVYTAHQAFTAMAAKADYAAPYLGRMNDAGKNGRGEIVSMQQMIDAMGSSMRLLVASVRSPEDIVALASRGCDTFTISPQCADQLFGEPMTWQAAQQFERDAASLGAS